MRKQKENIKKMENQNQDVGLLKNVGAMTDNDASNFYKNKVAPNLTPDQKEGLRAQRYTNPQSLVLAAIDLLDEVKASSISFALETQIQEKQNALSRTQIQER
jgi:hypothetical protein